MYFKPKLLMNVQIILITGEFETGYGKSVFTTL